MRRQQHIHIEEPLKMKVSWTIFNNRFHNAIEDTLVNALWIVVRLQQNGGTGAISTAFAPVLSHTCQDSA